LKVRVRAPPHEGQANAALLRLLAKSLRVPVHHVSVAAGASARIKRVQVAGAPAALASALESLCVRAGASNRQLSE
jgi:uncharacterized protein YggU (UPF0235/DUF167 family)